MITPQEAERRAHQLIEEYVNAAGCRSKDDVANVLMKLASLTGFAIAAVAGKDDAVRRMQSCVTNVATAAVQRMPGADYIVRRAGRPDELKKGGLND